MRYREKQRNLDYRTVQEPTRHLTHPVFHMTAVSVFGPKLSGSSKLWNISWAWNCHFPVSWANWHSSYDRQWWWLSWLQRLFYQYYLICINVFLLWPDDTLFGQILTKMCRYDWYINLLYASLIQVHWHVGVVYRIYFERGTYFCTVCLQVSLFY